jgi:uncharacterized membrane protein
MWSSANGPQRLLIAAGTILLASGLFHVGVYVMQDGAWEGPVSWRKPIEFGISGGLTTLSLAAVMSRLPPTGWLAWSCAVAISLFLPETALIDLQRWRGVPSHFNHDTAFDVAVFSWMGILIAVVSLGIMVMTVWTFRSLQGPGSSVLAIRAGMVFLTIGQVLGFAIVTNGLGVDDLSRASIFGAAGEMKVPHAVALHGLQALGVLALLLERTTLPESRRTWLVLVGIAGYTLALIVATIQTFGGRAPLDLMPLAVVGAALALLMLAIAYAAALRATRMARAVRGLPAN